jgi:cbb3-type cytochrome oxidase cytochrome c subunit
MMEVEKKVKNYEMAVKKLEDELDELLKDVNKWQTKMESIEEKTLKIQQVIIEEFDRNTFGQPVQRVDRCMTCHLGSMDKLFVNDKQPYKYHSNQEILLKHNPEKFGCSGCHDGQGRALSSVGDAHGTTDHYWEKPLLTGKFAEGNCLKCHSNMIDFPIAPNITMGKKLAMDMGCIGCHDLATEEKIDKVGPPLNNVTKKTTSEWLYRWISNPRDYSANTRMPNFWPEPIKASAKKDEKSRELIYEFSARYDKNSPEYKTYEETKNKEVSAIVSYINFISKDGNYEPTFKMSGTGSAINGEKLVKAIGCQGCHVVGGNKFINRLKEGQSFGPDLTKVGSKVKKEWLYDWLKNPKHYFTNTKMPDLRLTDREALDITEYLMTLKEKDPASEIKLADLDDPEKIQEGKKLVRLYGCYGCHEIKGMEAEAKVSVPLTEFGDKTAHDLFFGDADINHHDRNWYSWIFIKLKKPRIYETEKIIQRMPDFEFTDEESEALMVFLKASTADKTHIPPAYRSPKTERQLAIDKGRLFIRERNCIGCHRIEGRGWYIAENYEDASFAPPFLESQGFRVQYTWLYSFLKNPTPIRSWLEIRMPSFHFNDDELATVMKYFSALDGRTFGYQEIQEVKLESQSIEAGRKLFTMFKCQSCHPFGGVGERKAPDLAKIRTRLHPDWVIKFLNDPQKLIPNVNMPTFIPDDSPSPAPDILGGDKEKQIKALRDFMWSAGRGAQMTMQ